MQHTLNELEKMIEKLRAVFSAPANSWHRYAICAGTDEDIWFNPERGEEAKSICYQCPVRVECLDDAIFWDDIACVRGGFNDGERVKIQTHRQRYRLAYQATIDRALRRNGLV